MFRKHIGYVLGVLLLQGCCSLPNATVPPANGGESTVSIKVAITTLESEAATYAHFCIHNKDPHPIKLQRWEEWEKQPRLVLTCSNESGKRVTLKEDGLRRWPVPPATGATNIEEWVRYSNATMGSHSSNVETIPQNSFVTFSVPVSRYFKVSPVHGKYVLGGRVEVLLGPSQIPTWVSFQPVRFQVSEGK